MSLTFLTIDEVASSLKLSRDTVYRLASSGELPGRKVGRAWRFVAEEIEDCIAHDYSDRQQTSRARVEFEEQKGAFEETILARTAELTEANRRLQTEIAERHQTEAYLRAVFASVGDGLVVANENYEIVLFNRAAEEILGIGTTDAEPEQWPELFGIYLADGTTPCPAIELPLVRAVGGERVEHCELVIRNANLPAPVWLDVRAAPVLNDSGHLMGGAVVFHDITARKKAADQYRRSEERLRNVLDCLPQMLASMNEADAEPTSPDDALAGILANVAPSNSIN
jgi:excisionase family DNA binding protein